MDISMKYEELLEREDFFELEEIPINRLDLSQLIWELNDLNGKNLSPKEINEIIEKHEKGENTIYFFGLKVKIDD